MDPIKFDRNIGGGRPGSGPKSTDEASQAKHLMQRASGMMGKPGYDAFMDALEQAYTLGDLAPGQLRWVKADGTKALAPEELTAQFVQPPTVITKTGEDAPMMSVALVPKIEGKPVTATHKYHAPLLVKDVNRWQFVKDSLGQYPVNGRSGVEESEEMLDEPITLSEIIDRMGEGGVSDNTPVVESLVLLPIAPNGEFETEFSPQLRFDNGDHNHYEVSVIHADKMNAFTQLTNGRNSIDIKDVDQAHNEYDFQADFVSDLSDFEQALKPESAGHMILIAKPVEKPKSKIFDTDFDFSEFFDSGRDTNPVSKNFGGYGAMVGDVNIGRGSKTGSGSLYEGELKNTKRGTATIYHLKFLGVKPEVIKQLKSGNIFSQLGQSLDSYPMN